TTEQRPGAAVVPRNMPAGVARLGGVPGVYPGHRTAPSLCFVRDETPQLGERPAVATPRLFALAGLDAGADIKPRHDLSDTYLHSPL
ncbi:MAG: hypothetical protein AVDCRST_MAG18-3468, partial [uncultured Thermomicrobiales bacterium]